MLREADAHICTRCGRRYPILAEVPLFVDEVVAEHDELDHLLGDHHRGALKAGDEHKAAQSAYFDRTELAEFEIERPAGTPALHRFLLAEKIRRSLEPFDGRLEGWTALTVCGGSGMDAEFLAIAGARVISSDLSLGAAERARERARRHGLEITPVVADVEHLPFADRSVDLVFVHDGLHHLEDPGAGLAEMARVARRAICVNEPAQATVTAIGMRFGLALEREEAGNRVARLEVSPTVSSLESFGFRVIQADRYAMYYRHMPGRLSELLSRRGALHLSIAAWRLANRVIGRFGNKLSIVAVR